ncbi:possible transcriptional regulator, WhiB family protein (plasmid) [Rhodococcus jostii RHA1]|uniref:Transcriptional regulator WhiB n=1 Tax=Rhodococcus jostii (strain RHA1) TaxID=101510 RepID=Q0RX44_RHOJR|nr:WhiB family transcriptional regulator [Rhodococcus jostii]ABH00142.1 possible transcriptional regulator, WhiB family protein [Rhodococcus jostii RHA1]
MPDQFHRPLDRDWQHRALYRGTDTDLFFSPDGERGNVRARRERAAKQICQDCPALDNCRAHALTATEGYGIWGDMSETERARHARRTRLPARPREHVVPTDPLTWRIRTPRA